MHPVQHAVFTVAVLVVCLHFRIGSAERRDARQRRLVA